MRKQTAIATLSCLFALAAAAAPTARHAKVTAAAQTAALALPFNVQNSTQAFQKTQSGGIQQLVAKDPNDKALVAAIRSYLEKEAVAFGNADYSVPTRIDGKAVPAAPYFGSSQAGQIAITYRNVAAGAAIDYVGNDAASISAIHGWIDAQFDADDDGT